MDFKSEEESSEDMNDSRLFYCVEDYAPSNSMDLGMKVGDLIVVKTMDEGAYWFGCQRNDKEKEGMFPRKKVLCKESQECRDFIALQERIKANKAPPRPAQRPVKQLSMEATRTQNSDLLTTNNTDFNLSSSSNNTSSQVHFSGGSSNSKRMKHKLALKANKSFSKLREGIDKLVHKK